MKKSTFLAMCMAILLASCSNQSKTDKQADGNEASTQKNTETSNNGKVLSVEDIASQWANKVINVDNGGQVASIEKLVDAFNSTWPSEVSKGEKEVDAANGYLMQMEGNKILSACFWKRAN